MIRKIFRWTFVCAVFLGLAWVLVQNSGSIEWARIGANPRYFAGVLALCIVDTGVQFLTWFYLVNRRGRSFELGPGYALFGISWLSRYLPAGKVLQFVSLFHFAEDPRQRLNSATSMFIAMVSGLLAGGVVAVLGVRSVVPTLSPWLIMAGMAALVIGTMLLSRPEFLVWLIRIAGRRFSALGAPPSLSLGALGIATLLSIASWLAEGLAALLLLWLVDPAHPAGIFWFMMTCYAVASLSGYLAFIAPSGLGVREGVFVLLLQLQIPLVEAVFISLTLRFALTVADLLFSLPLLFNYVRVRLAR